jgi:hypothetical protein
MNYLCHGLAVSASRFVAFVVLAYQLPVIPAECRCGVFL